MGQIARKYKGKEAKLCAFLEKKYARAHYFDKLQADLSSQFFNPSKALALAVEGGAKGSRVTVPRTAAPRDNLSKCRDLVRSLS